MIKVKLNYLIIISLLTYLSFTFYGLFFNFTWVDESKYLIKGYLMASGKVSLYNTPGFPYQHMPLAMPWFGLGQLLAGPSLLVGRLQGMITGLAVLFLSYKLSVTLKNKTAGLITLLLLSFSFNTVLHYSTATPEAIVAFFFVLAFLILYQALRKNSVYLFILASCLFTIIFLLRENFLPTLFVYYAFLLIILAKKPVYFLFNLLVSFSLIFIVFFFCYPGITKILANFPILNLFLATPLERQVLDIHWYTANFTNELKFGALYQLLRTYQLFFLFSFMIFIFYISRLKKTYQVLKKPRIFYFIFMLSVILLNFFVHLFIAFKLSPRAIIPYFDYIFPLCAILAGVMFTNVWKAISLTPFKSLFFYFLIILIFLSFNPTFSPLFQLPGQKSTLIQINQDAQTLTKFIPADTKVFFLGETIPLYLAGKDTYWPLYNGLNLFKPGAETKIVNKYGFWNEELAQEWLKEAGLLVMERSKWQRVNQEKPLQNLKMVFEQELPRYRLKEVINNYYGNDILLIYEKIQSQFFSAL